MVARRLDAICPVLFFVNCKEEGSLDSVMRGVFIWKLTEPITVRLLIYLFMKGIVVAGAGAVCRTLLPEQRLSPVFTVGGFAVVFPPGLRGIDLRTYTAAD